MLIFSDTDIGWHWHWLRSEIFEFWKFLFFSIFLFFEISFILRYHFFWYYLFLDIIWLSHFLTLKLTRSWHSLSLTLSESDITWILTLSYTVIVSHCHWLRSEILHFWKFFLFIFFEISFFFFLRLFISRYYLILTWSRSWHYLTVTLYVSDITWILTLSDTLIVWHWHWLSSEIFEFWKCFTCVFVFLFEISFFFWHFIFFFQISFFLMLFISWFYLTLTLPGFWHYLILSLSDTDIDWDLKF